MSLVQNFFFSFPVFFWDSVNIKPAALNVSLYRPTFYKIYKRKTSEGFQALPYSMGLLCASLLLYYALLQSGKFLIITINIIGSVFQITYLTLFIIYSPRTEKVTALSLSMAHIASRLSFQIFCSCALWRFCCLMSLKCITMRNNVEETQIDVYNSLNVSHYMGLLAFMVIEI